MAPPSRVPGTGRLVSYGPTAGTAIADLPVAYVTAWTPKEDPARIARSKELVLPGRAGVAASYVLARIDGIAGDLGALKPGGRNTAIYLAALRVGSTLAAARSTPGTEQALAMWTDQAAEEALMAAAEQNGYIGDHSAAEARSAVRSGLRNGLRSPRPLPEFGRRRAAPNMAHQKSQEGPQRREGEASISDATGMNPALIRDLNQACPPRSLSASRRLEPRSGRVLEPAGDWQDAIASKELEEWRPGVPSCPRRVVAESEGPEIA